MTSLVDSIKHFKNYHPSFTKSSKRKHREKEYNELFLNSFCKTIITKTRHHKKMTDQYILCI